MKIPPVMEGERILAERVRWVNALCPSCYPGHVLENNRVWALCGARRVVNCGFSEEEIAEVIRSLPALKLKWRKAGGGGKEDGVKDFLTGAFVTLAGLVIVALLTVFAIGVKTLAVNSNWQPKAVALCGYMWRQGSAPSPVKVIVSPDLVLVNRQPVTVILRRCQASTEVKDLKIQDFLPLYRAVNEAAP